MKLSQSKCTVRIRPTLTALAMAIAAIPTNAVLADGKEYPGSMCKESVDGYGIKRATGDVVFSADGDALNISTTSMRYVSCPLVRDNDPAWGGINYAAVSFYKPSNAGVGCTLFSKPYFGGAGWYQVKWDSSSAGLRLMEFQGKRDGYVSGSFNLFCHLAKTVAGQKSGIAHYGAVE